MLRYQAFCLFVFHFLSMAFRHFKEIPITWAGMMDLRRF